MNTFLFLNSNTLSNLTPSMATCCKTDNKTTMTSLCFSPLSSIQTTRTQHKSIYIFNEPRLLGREDTSSKLSMAHNNTVYKAWNPKPQISTHATTMLLQISAKNNIHTYRLQAMPFFKLVQSSIGFTTGNISALLTQMKFPSHTHCGVVIPFMPFLIDCC